MPCGNGNYKLPRAVLAALSLTVCVVLWSPFHLRALGDGLVCCLTQQGQDKDSNWAQNCVIVPSLFLLPGRCGMSKWLQEHVGSRDSWRTSGSAKPPPAPEEFGRGWTLTWGTTRWGQHQQRTQLRAFSSSKLRFDEAPPFMKSSPRLVFAAGQNSLGFIWAIMHLCYETPRCRSPSFLEKSKPASSKGWAEFVLFCLQFLGLSPFYCTVWWKDAAGRRWRPAAMEKKMVMADAPGDWQKGTSTTSKRIHTKHFHFLIPFCRTRGQQSLFIIL